MESVNTYIKNPIKLYLYNPIENRITKNYIFLTGKIIDEVENYYNDKEYNEDTLQKYFGDYKSVLDFNFAFQSDNIKYGGGDEIDEELFASSNDNNSSNGSNSNENNNGNNNVDESNFDNLFEKYIIQKDTIEQVHKIPVVDYTKKIEIIKDQQIFPLDNLVAVKEKIFLATGIDVYRQHLILFNNNIPIMTYQFFIDYRKYSVNIFKILTHSLVRFGIPIDKYIVQSYQSVSIKSLERFLSITDYETTIVVVDLFEIIKQLKANIIEIVNDPQIKMEIYYGCIFKYYPWISISDFYTLLQMKDLNNRTNIGLFIESPRLYVNYDLLHSKYTEEKKLFSDFYTKINNPTYFNKIREKVFLSITEAWVSTHNSIVDILKINLNLLFNLMECNDTIPYIHYILNHGTTKYLVYKHIIGFDKKSVNFRKLPEHFCGGEVFNTSEFIKVIKSDKFTIESIMCIIIIEGKKYFFNLQENSKYEIFFIYNVDLNISLENSKEILKSDINDIISIINSYSDKIYNNPSLLLPEISDINIKFIRIDFSIIWKKSFNNENFQNLIASFENYIKAGVIIPKEQQSSIRTFEFKIVKGTYNFNINYKLSRALDLKNTYIYLTDNSIYERWLFLYSGKKTKLTQRNSDIKLDITSVNQKEYFTIVSYFYILFANFINSGLFTKEVGDVITSKSSKSLSKLKEQDPNLYNLKLYDSEIKYSVFCQQPMQPTIYSIDEVKSMPATKRAKLIKYHNFTTKQEVYYDCPSKKYPELGFVVGKHPMKYCIPCCRKVKKTQLGKKHKINQICLQEFIIDEQDIEEVNKKHILSYDKFLDDNRLSNLSTSLSDRLNTFSMYLVGIAQTLQNSMYIGLINSLAFCLGYSFNEFIKIFCTKLITHPNKKEIFSIILNGGNIYFSSIENLISTINYIFISQELNVSQKFTKWNKLFMQLCESLFGLYTIIIKDYSNEISYINLSIKPSVYYNLISNTKIKYCVIIKKQKYYYPLVLCSPKKYFKDRSITKKIYELSDNIITVIKDIIKENKSNNPDLKIIDTLYPNKITTKYINSQGYCYAIMLKDLYLPLDYCIDIFPDIQNKYTIPDSFNYIGSLDLLEELNKKLKGVFMYYVDVILFLNDEVVGILLNRPHKFMPLKMDIKKLEKYSIVTPKTKYKEIYFDPIEINNKIYKYNTSVNKLESLKTLNLDNDLINQTLYKNYSFQLLKLELFNKLNKEKNTEIREQIYNILRSDKFIGTIDLSFKAINKLIKNYPEDYNLIIKVINNYLLEFKFNINDLIFKLDKMSFLFDRTLIYNIKNSPKEEGMKLLKECLSDIIIIEDIKIEEMPNILVPCGKTHSSYCRQNKLILPTGLLDKYVEIMVDDIKNELKLLEYIYYFETYEIINHFKFIEKDSEHLGVITIQ